MFTSLKERVNINIFELFPTGKLIETMLETPEGLKHNLKVTRTKDKFRTENLPKNAVT